MTTLDAAYFGREQTAVKHFVLRQYVTALALIVGRSFARDITYIDCCSGPWNTVTEDLSDTSFGIATQQFRLVRDQLQTTGRSVSFRCLFVEKDSERYDRLKRFCDAVSDIEVKPLLGDFTALVPRIMAFVAEAGDSFPFFFIDPTGWKPLRIAPLTPLLQATPAEVLVNFMTSHIRRFLEVEEKDFGELLSASALERVKGLTGQDRDDAAAFAYADQIARAGNFPYVCTTLVLNPHSNQTHYHLIYATRHHKGVQAFKQAERRARDFMALARADAQQRRRTTVSNQPDLFPVADYGAGVDHHLVTLRDRYLAQAHSLVEVQLSHNKRRPISYDDAWRIACRFPLVWESDLHRWIREWRDKVDVLGLKPNQRVPKCQAGNQLMWIA